MQDKNLKNVSTKHLVEELKNRQGVNHISVIPNEKFKITTGYSETEDVGPAILLIIID